MQHKTSHKHFLQCGGSDRLMCYDGIIHGCYFSQTLKKTGCTLKEMGEKLVACLFHMLFFFGQIYNRTLCCIIASIDCTHYFSISFKLQEFIIYYHSLCGKNVLSRFILSLLSSTCVVLSLTKCHGLLDTVRIDCSNSCCVFLFRKTLWLKRQTDCTPVGRSAI